MPALRTLMALRGLADAGWLLFCAEFVWKFDAWEWMGRESELVITMTQSIATHFSLERLPNWVDCNSYVLWAPGIISDQKLVYFVKDGTA